MTLGPIRLRAAGVLLVVPFVAGPTRTAEEAAAPDPQPAIEEHVEVLLVETVVRAADRRGGPLVGLTREDVEVSEGGDARRVAYFEPFLSQGHEITTEDGTPTATLYDTTGAPVERAPVRIVPPRPARRIVLAFDVNNSKVRTREGWKRAAAAWVGASMTDADRVGVVVLRAVPEWVQPMTNSPTLVGGVLDSLDLAGRASQRDRRSEMIRLHDEISACASVSESGRSPVPAGGGPYPGSGNGSAMGSSDEVDCALKVAEPWVAQWNTESLESVAALRMLTGELAAIPGRKEVLLFSEGIIPDAAGLAVDAMLSIFGTDRMNHTAVSARLQLNALAEITKLHDAARGAGTAYFTFDTRTAGERGYNDSAEVERPTHNRSVGANPFTETYAETNATLTTLAEETGGDSYRGTEDLGERVAAAAEGYFGTYALGFYRPPGVDRPGKLHVKVVRKGVELTYMKKPFRPPAPARRAQLELSIRNPEPSGVDDRQRLPVVLDLQVAELPFRNADGTWGCQLGYFVQAARPDGTVVTEAFQDVTVALDDSPKDRGPGTVYRQLLRLDLPTGPFRLRARVSDDRQAILAERTIDLTLGPGAVRGGIHAD